MEIFQRKESKTDGNDNNLHNPPMKTKYAKLFRENQKTIFLVLVTQLSSDQQPLAQLSSTEVLYANTRKHLRSFEFV